MIQYFDDKDIAYFDGLSFRKDKKTGYYLNAKTHKRLHVYVWEYYHGDIPPGYCVHHADFNKGNNEIENLVLMSQKEHLSLHGNAWTKERYEKQLDILKNYAVPKASEWHRSKAGAEWHKSHYEVIKNRLFQKKKFVCEVCGKEYEAVDRPWNKFCSNKCKAKARRESGVDNETRICSICGREFSANKYSKAKTCSKHCASKLRWYKVDTENKK